MSQGSKLSLLAKSKLFNDRFPELSKADKQRMNVQVNKKNKMYKFNPFGKKDGDILDTGAPINTMSKEQDLLKYRKKYGMDIQN